MEFKQRTLEKMGAYSPGPWWTTLEIGSAIYIRPSVSHITVDEHFVLGMDIRQHTDSVSNLEIWKIPKM